MRYSQYFLPTLKETPGDAEVISHQLMARAGMIRKVAAGVYDYLPLGLRVIRKVENIVREEMNRAGAIELLMPAVDLVRFVDGPSGESPSGDSDSGEIDLAAIPASRLQLTRIELTANLFEAQALFNETGAEALVVKRVTAPGVHRVYGVLLREALDKAYRV